MELSGKKTPIRGRIVFTGPCFVLFWFGLVFNFGEKLEGSLMTRLLIIFCAPNLGSAWDPHGAVWDDKRSESCLLLWDL